MIRKKITFTSIDRKWWCTFALITKNKTWYTYICSYYNQCIEISKEKAKDAPRELDLVE
jgi:hypothetical protein